MAQNLVFFEGKGVKMKKITIFDKKVEKNFVGSEKSVTFALAIKKRHCNDKKTLGYGVMVTLQILVLSFLVRIRVSQPKASFFLERCFFCFREFCG